MAETPAILEAVRRVATGGAPLSAEELAALRHHVSGLGYEPGALKRASSDLVGARWSGGIVQRGDRLPAAERDFLKHARAGEWPIGTSLAAFVQTVRQAVLSDSGGIYLDRGERGGWILTFIAYLDHARGPLGSGWVLVGFDVDYGWWTTAFQPVDGPRYVEDRSTSGVGRWLVAP